MTGDNFVTRRGFLATAGAVTLGAGSNWAVAADDEAWALPVLGDLHIDRPEHHDAEWLKRTHPDDVRQVENYCRVTRDVTPKLLDVVRGRAAGSRLPVPFALQLGDLLEGLCGSEELAARQADDGLGLVREAKLPVPFLFCKGNHDIAGPGAAAVYDKVLVPFLAKQAGGGVRRAAFARRRGGTLVVFYDAYDRDSLDWFEGLLRDRRPGRLIFVIHPPVVPFNARSTWHVYSSPKQEGQRERLLNLLGAARAVVLCGHLHKYSFLVRRTEKGRFSQLAISSVATDAAAKPKDLLEGADRYGPELVKLEPKHSPDTLERRRAVLEAERPLVERFEYADTWGHAVLAVRGDSVTAEVCRGLGTDRWKTLDLTGPLG